MLRAHRCDARCDDEHGQCDRRELQGTHFHVLTQTTYRGQATQQDAIKIRKIGHGRENITGGGEELSDAHSTRWINATTRDRIAIVVS